MPSGVAERHDVVRERMGGLLCLALVLTLTGGCQSDATSSTPADARALLQAAITAHGGRERLARFDDFRIVSQVLFKDHAKLRRTVDFRGRDHWAMTVTAENGGSFRMGVDGTRCWKQDRYRVESCAEGERRQIELMAIDHNAWVLLWVDEATVQLAEPVRVGAHSFPAIRAGDLILVFDPDSHRLVRIRHQERLEELSDFRRIDGALIATHRSVFIDGKPDLEETWTEILPGGSDDSALLAPAVPADGAVVDAVDAVRLVAWTDVDDPIGNAKASVARLDDFIRRQGRRPSGSEGLVWTAPEEAGGRWQLAVGVEVGDPLQPVTEAGLHLEQWPALRVLGLFHRGDFHAAEQQEAALRRLMEERSLAASPGARLQILAGRDVLDGPPADSLFLVRIPVRARDEAAEERQH